LKLLTQNFFSAKDVKCIRKTKLPAKNLLWLAVSESGISEPVFFKANLAVSKEMYISKVFQYFIIYTKTPQKGKKCVLD
jgi:hypothetical protein